MATSYKSLREWEGRNYKSYKINLRHDTDSDLIKYVEEHKAAEGTTNIFREALELLIKSKEDK